MTGLLFLGVVLLFSRAAALSSAEEWSGFADNFATDLAPLITLFGEQVSRQFLSESTGVLDNIIFGLAPLGILTAVVSAIRLYGQASLKSFIGRAQEAHGVAEAELCSSTSYDVCELWSNGGICRVFGQPKILEFIYTRRQTPCPTDADGAADDEDPDCGIYLSKDVLSDVLSYNAPDSSKRHWREIGVYGNGFAPFPNLSLNVGTRRTSKKSLLFFAAVGLLLEASFFLYATWATFYNPSFYTEDDAPHLWSFILGMMGTFSLVCGMSLCARLVERRSTERRFERRDWPDEAKPRIFWLQCGNQRVGDQQFRSFAYSEEKEQYMTSFIHKPDLLPIFGLPPRIVLWAAIVSSLLGFACQFVGFRGLHGSITLYQLACTLIMAGVRAGLRSRRLGREKNRLESFHRLSESDELDWQALSIVGDDYPLKCDGLAKLFPRQDDFSLMNSHLDTGLKGSPLSKAAQAMLLTSSAVEVLLSKGDVGSGVVGFRPSARGGREKDTLCFKSAAKFIRVLEGNPKCFKLDFQPLDVYDPGKMLPDFDLNPAARTVNIRARLGQLSGDKFQPSGIPWDPELQAVAKRLQNALQNALSYIFAKAPLQSGWKGTEALVWSAVCEHHVLQTTSTALMPMTLALPIHFLSYQKGQQWTINEHQLAAVMSLWRNSILHRDWDVEQHFQSTWWSDNRKIIQAVQSPEHTAAVIRLWIAKESALEKKFVRLKNHDEARLVPFRLSLDKRVRLSSYGWRPYASEVTMQYPTNYVFALLLSLSTPGTLLDMIAQDIYTIFMFEVASVMDKLTEVSVRQPVGSSLGTTILSDHTSSELSNTHIDALARFLCEAGLATKEASLMCVVPALFHHGKLPSLDNSVGRLLADARKLRTDRQYEKGEAHLKSLVRMCSPQHHEKVLRTLGELYRHALRSSNEVHRDFGLRAMADLKKDLVRPGGQNWSNAAMRALSDYEELAKFLHDAPGRTGSKANWKGRANLVISSVLELQKLRDQGPEERSRLKTLIVLENHDMTGRNNSVLHELLFVAIALGHVEVLDDLRALNPDLVFEMPSLATLQENPICLTASIATKFNANNAAHAEGRSRRGSSVGFLATAWAASQLEDEASKPPEAEDVFRMMLEWASVTRDFTDDNNNTPLMYAVSSGNIRAVEIFLESGSDVQIWNTTGETALSRAIKFGHLSIAERILKEGQDRENLPHVYLHHALVVALNDRKRDFVEMLLRNGASIDYRDERGETPLSAALQPFWNNDAGDGKRDPVLVSILLEHGATVGHRLNDIVELAVENLQTDWIRHLHDHGHDVIGSPILKNGLAALLRNNIPTKRELDPNFPHAPINRHQIDALISLLFELGLSVQPGDLHHAVRLRPSDEILSAVLKEGIANNTILKDHGTPLQTLLNHDLCGGPVEEHERILNMMLLAGCDPNLDSPDWKATPLQIACLCSEARVRMGMIRERRVLLRGDSENIAMILIRAKADVNLTAADIPGEGQRLVGSTPLELACFTGKAEVVQALIDAGAEVNTPGREFGPPLQAACLQVGQRSEDDVEIVRALIRAGANVNAVTSSGDTALAAAAHSLLPEQVEALLDAGADPNIRTLSEPADTLFPKLLLAFESMQTGDFTGSTPDRSTEGSWKLAVHVVELFAQHDVVLSLEELSFSGYLKYDHICFQHEFSEKSPEEIRLSDYTGGPRYGPEAPPVMGRIDDSPSETFNLLGPVIPPGSESQSSLESPFGNLVIKAGPTGFGSNAGQGGLFTPISNISGFGSGLFGSSAGGFDSLGSSSPTQGERLFGRGGLFEAASRGGGSGGLFGTSQSPGGFGSFGSTSPTQEGGMSESNSSTQGEALFGSSSPTKEGELSESNSSTQGEALFGSSSPTQEKGLSESNSST